MLEAGGIIKPHHELEAEEQNKISGNSQQALVEATALHTGPSPPAYTRHSAGPQAARVQLPLLLQSPAAGEVHSGSAAAGKTFLEIAFMINKKFRNLNKLRFPRFRNF